MMIVMGTSLKIPGVKLLIKEFAKRIGSKKNGICILVNATELVSKEWEEVFDFHVLGKSDEFVADVMPKFKKYLAQAESRSLARSKSSSIGRSANVPIILSSDSSKESKTSSCVTAKPRKAQQQVVAIDSMLKKAKKVNVVGSSKKNKSEPIDLGSSSDSCASPLGLSNGYKGAELNPVVPSRVKPAVKTVKTSQSSDKSPEELKKPVTSGNNEVVVVKSRTKTTQSRIPVLSPRIKKIHPKSVAINSSDGEESKKEYKLLSQPRRQPFRTVN